MRESEIYDFNIHLARYLHDNLVKFRKFNCSTPTGLTEEEWDGIIDEMIYGFNYAANDHRINSEEDMEKVYRSFELLKKWYFDLWI